MHTKSFTKNMLIYGIGGTLTRLIFVFTTPVYTRLLDTEGFGRLEFITSVGTILVILMSMEMHSGYGRSYFESKSRGHLKNLRGSVMIYYFLTTTFWPMGELLSVIRLMLSKEGYFIVYGFQKNKF